MSPTEPTAAPPLSPFAITTTEAGKTTVFYNPLPHQEAFHASQSPNFIIGGGRSSGKCKAICVDEMLRCISTLEFKALILRREMPELRRTHLFEIEHELAQRGGDRIGTYHKTDFRVYFKKESVLEFGHCENDEAISKYLAAEYDAIYFDELASFTLDQFLQISTSARVPQYSGRLAIVLVAPRRNSSARGSSSLTIRRGRPSHMSGSTSPASSPATSKSIRPETSIRMRALGSS